MTVIYYQYKGIEANKICSFKCDALHFSTLVFVFLIKILSVSLAFISHGLDKVLIIYCTLLNSCNYTQIQNWSCTWINILYHSLVLIQVL